MDRLELFDWVREKYGTEPEHPWQDWNAVLRRADSGKWYGVVQEIPENKLGLAGDRIVDVLNVKCDPTMVGALRMQAGYYPAYHMNKERWISIILDGTVSKEEITGLLDLSYELTGKKMKPRKKQNNNNPIVIRQELPSDQFFIYQLVKEAFESAEHADGNEQDLVEALRESCFFIPELSLVAEVGGELAGHILFTKAMVGQDEVLALAPLSVLPQYQRHGVGAALIKEGHRIARKLGFSYSVVLGSDAYYPKFGYIPATEYGVELPDGFPPECFMAVKLQDEAAPLSGEMVYAEEFGL